MGPATMAGLLLGIGLGAGVLLVVAGWRGWSPGSAQVSTSRRWTLTRATWIRIAVAIGAAFIVGLITRWPVAALGAGAIVFLWPYLFGGAAEGRRDIARLDGLATWTESLRDTIAGAIGLEQAIPATALNAPASLAEPLDRLVARLKVRTPLPEALSYLADDLDDPDADLIVASLILNARTRGPGLRSTLSALTVASREALEQRQKSEARRRTLRRSARIIVGITLGFAAALSVVARDWMAIYATPIGQVVLLVVFGIFAIGFAWLRKLSVTPKPDRFLAGADTIRVATVGGARR